MEEVAQELKLRGAYVELKNLPPEEGETLGHLDLLVHMGDEQNFVYQIWPQQYSVPGFDGLQQGAGDYGHSGSV
jgi:choline/glycine/proline betaine transport protein